MTTEIFVFGFASGPTPSVDFTGQASEGDEAYGGARLELITDDSSALRKKILDSRRLR
jgi:hypothetical protein